jgi:hypothetical protein
MKLYILTTNSLAVSLKSLQSKVLEARVFGDSVTTCWWWLVLSVFLKKRLKIFFFFSLGAYKGL